MGLGLKKKKKKKRMTNLVLKRLHQALIVIEEKIITYELKIKSLMRKVEKQIKKSPTLSHGH